MTIENISLFQAMNAKMNYLALRQKVISQNVANADTPDYRPSDLSTVDFGKMVTNVTHEKSNTLTMAATDPNHIPPKNAVDTRSQVQKVTYEVSPDGNGVNLEEQMMKSNDVQMNYNLMVNLYRNNMDMIRASLGKK